MNQLATKEQTQPVAEQHEASLLEVIAKAASDPSVDVNKMRALLDMRRDLERDEAKRLFSDAMNVVQESIKAIAADAANDQTKSKYATYYALDKALRPIYSAHGFEVSFNTEDTPKPEHIRVVCTVSHRAGHSRSHRIDMPADGKGAKGGDVMTKTHAAGSALTYGKRYTLGMAFNIAIGSDDDGNAAGEEAFITSEQAIELERLVKETGTDKDKFLGWLKVDGYLNIPARHFDAAKQALEEKTKQRETA